MQRGKPYNYALCLNMRKEKTGEGWDEWMKRVEWFMSGEYYKVWTVEKVALVLARTNRKQFNEVLVMELLTGARAVALNSYGYGLDQ